LLEENTINSNSFKQILHFKNNQKLFQKQSEFQGFWDSQRGNIVLNNEGLKQELSNEYFRFSNNLKSIFH
jgi:hypothetical protein